MTLPPAEPFVDEGLTDEIAARLDLREPNHDALRSIAFAVSRHYDVEGGDPPYEAVVDAATGLGKTYIIAATIEYYAALGVRNFAIVTPGRTILEKTVNNFTRGHPKSLVEAMDTRPVVITSENFATADMRVVMEDPEEVKLFVFNVQALLRPTTKAGRRTHDFQEGLGEAFYEHLEQLDDLVVFADEHHVYFGPKFSSTIRDLKPRVLIGLTGTPHRRTPDEQIIYRYPLAAAIATQYVKMPVIAGRKDGRTDPDTKLRDGVALLDAKANRVATYRQEHPDAREVNPVMLVVANSIEEAADLAERVRAPDFAEGRFAEAVLEVHSDSPDNALAKLDTVEHPDSPVRVIVSVAMLKEGWDVSNVYVIASFRPSVSEILTEQTLGRGLRLPFGSYTCDQMLDTLEVLAHERFETLLQNKGVINEQFVDYRTLSVAPPRPARERVTQLSWPAPVTVGPEGVEALIEPDGSTAAYVASTEGRLAVAESSAGSDADLLIAREDLPTLELPRLTARSIPTPFSLNDITDLAPFRELGRKLSLDPVAELRRKVIRAELVTGPDGLPRTEIRSERASDVVISEGRLLTLEELNEDLLKLFRSAEIVPARRSEASGAERLIKAMVDGMGETAAETLSSYFTLVAGQLIRLVTDEHRKYVHDPEIEDEVEIEEFRPRRVRRTPASRDLTDVFAPGRAYEGWARGYFDQVWFDSSPERAFARAVDGSSDVQFWLRLHRNDLPILWSSYDEWYNPDFIIVDDDSVHWLVEVKADVSLNTEVVQEKRTQALRWAQHATGSGQAGEWRYLLLSEESIGA